MNSLIFIYHYFHFIARSNAAYLGPRSPRSTSSSTSSSPTFLTGGIATVKKDSKSRQKGNTSSSIDGGSGRGSVDPFIEESKLQNDRSLGKNTNSSSRELQEYLQVCIITLNSKSNLQSLSIFLCNSFSLSLPLLLSQHLYLSLHFPVTLFLSNTPSLSLSLSTSLPLSTFLCDSFSLHLFLFFSLFHAQTIIAKHAHDFSSSAFVLHSLYWL